MTAAIVVVAVSITMTISSVDDVSAVAGALLALSTVVLSAVAAVGLLLSRGRWARWTAISIPAYWVVVALATSQAWVVPATALIVTGVAAGPGSRGWLRTRASAHGPPPAAAALLLCLLSIPALLALVDFGSTSWLAIAAAAAALGASFAYSRGGMAGVLATRLLTVAATLLAWFAIEPPGRFVVLPFAAGLVIVTWLRVIRLAAAPVIPVPTRGYRIPPELAPKEVLDAAGLDDKGRSR